MVDLVCEIFVCMCLVGSGYLFLGFVLSEGIIVDFFGLEGLCSFDLEIGNVMFGVGIRLF